MDILPFDDGMIDAAAGVLAGQQRRLRKVYPALPERFGKESEARCALDSLWSIKDSEGFAAFEDGRLVAFMLGQRLLDSVSRGRCGWVELAGCAYEDRYGVEIVRDLYAALGHWWVAQGIFSHIMMASVFDTDLLQAMFSLGFGMEQVHGLVNLREVRPFPPALPAGIEIRRANAKDGESLATLSNLIWKEQVGPTVWGVMMPETVEKTAEAWGELGGDPEAIVWLASLDGQVMGMEAFWPADERQYKLHIPEKCIHLSVAVTRPEARGRGLGTLMTQTGLAYAFQEGFHFCEADWRSTNLLASRFWPRRDFRPVVYRLARRIDERIAWARGTVV